MRGGPNGGKSKNYQPNSYGGPVQTGEPLYNGFDVSGVTGARIEPLDAEDNDFRQAGDLYRLMPEDAKTRFVQNVAGSLSQVTLDEVITRSIEHFRNADDGLGERLTVAVRARRPAR